jgi:hypothetical protein
MSLKSHCVGFLKKACREKMVQYLDLIGICSHYLTFRNMLDSYGEGLLAPRTTQAGGPPVVGCPRLLIQCIRSCHPYLNAFSSIRNHDAPCPGDKGPT